MLIGKNFAFISRTFLVDLINALKFLFFELCYTKKCARKSVLYTTEDEFQQHEEYYLFFYVMLMKITFSPKTDCLVKFHACGRNIFLILEVIFKFILNYELFISQAARCILYIFVCLYFKNYIPHSFISGCGIGKKF